MKAAVVSVGTELTSGEVTDTNAAFLSRELADIGIETVRHVCVGDDEAALLSVLAALAREADLIIVTGGIGPTPDDVTRQGVAAAAGVPLVRNSDVLEHIRGMFAGWGRQMSQNNAIQADFPEGAEVISNPHGTAAGFSLRFGRAEVIVIPGVPAEMKEMWRASVRDRLRKKNAGITITRTLDCFGRGESDITGAIEDLMAAGRNPSVGDTAEDAIIRLRIRARAATQDQALKLIAAIKSEIRSRLGDVVFGEDNETLEGALVKVLTARGETIAAAESCTGGLAAKMITDVPGASACFLGGVIAYDNAVKVNLLGVDAALLETHGAASAEVALAMAEGVRARLTADVGISTTGIAGPSGGTPKKPVGLVYIAVTSARGAVSRTLNLRGDRARVRDRAAKHLLDLARRHILG